MLLKWGVVGAILGALLAILAGQTSDIILMAIIGACALISLRKWIFRKLWT
ncbi:hypothetical protein [Clostridium sporogenes]|uniref:hypothetical protein n=1 Tax=Clostridium sporogenes TaxID=1509 RepID=UPI000A8F076F|nr:hypothetical protein [Clostridium sporogenes]